MKRSVIVLLVLFAGLVAGPGLAQESAKAKYGGIEEAETVLLTDSKGVEIVATGFGKMFGAPYLNAYHGASEIEVPFDRIRSLATGPIADNRMEVQILLVSGRRMKVVLDRPEYETAYGGSSDFGYFRIRLMDIRTVEFRRPERSGEGLGQRCPQGHIYYNDTWRYCPYDGEELTPIGRRKKED